MGEFSFWFQHRRSAFRIAKWSLTSPLIPSVCSNIADISNIPIAKFAFQAWRLCYLFWFFCCGSGLKLGKVAFFDSEIGETGCFKQLGLHRMFWPKNSGFDVRRAGFVAQILLSSKVFGLIFCDKQAMPRNFSIPSDLANKLSRNRKFWNQSSQTGAAPTNYAEN